MILGIAGGSASGKSTLAKRLGEATGVAVLSMDSYYKPFEELPEAVGKDGKLYKDHNCPEAFCTEKLLEDLKSIPGDVILEGLFILALPCLRERCDVKIFLDCPADVRILRRVKRNLGWGLSFEAISEVYLALVRYRHEEYVAPSAVYADEVWSTENGVEECFEALLGSFFTQKS